MSCYELEVNNIVVIQPQSATKYYPTPDGEKNWGEKITPCVMTETNPNLLIILIRIITIVILFLFKRRERM